MTDEPKKDEEKKKLTPVRSKMPIRADDTSMSYEADALNRAFPIEIGGPNNIKFGTKKEEDLKDGEAVNLLSANGTDFGLVNRRYLIKKMPEGKLELTPMGDALGPQEVRDDLAHQIMNSIRKVVREETPKAVEDALRRKDIPTLLALKEGAEKGKKVKVTSERGCMYLTVGRRSILL